jgi:hypothetical protein
MVISNSRGFSSILFTKRPERPFLSFNVASCKGLREKNAASQAAKNAESIRKIRRRSERSGNKSSKILKNSSSKPVPEAYLRLKAITISTSPFDGYFLKWLKPSGFWRVLLFPLFSVKNILPGVSVISPINVTGTSAKF